MKTKILPLAAALIAAAQIQAAEPDFKDSFDNNTGSNIGGVNSNMAERQSGRLAPLEWAVTNAFIEKSGRFVFVTNPPQNAWATLDYNLNDATSFSISFMVSPDYDFSSQQKLDIGINFGIPSTEITGHPFGSDSVKSYLGFQRHGEKLRVGFWGVDGAAAYDQFLVLPDLDSFKVRITGKQTNGQWELRCKIPDADNLKIDLLMPEGWQPGHCALFARNGARKPAMAVFDDFSLNVK